MQSVISPERLSDLFNGISPGSFEEVGLDEVSREKRWGRALELLKQQGYSLDDFLNLADGQVIEYLTDMADTPIDRDLREYLEEGRRQRFTEGEKLDRVAEAVNRLTNEHLLMRQSVDNQFVLVQHQLAGINARVEKVEAKVEKEADVTGTTNIEALQQKLKDEREQKQFIYKAIIGVLGSLLVLGLTGAGTVIWFLITRAP